MVLKEQDLGNSFEIVFRMYKITFPNFSKKFIFVGTKLAAEAEADYLAHKFGIHYKPRISEIKV